MTLKNKFSPVSGDSIERIKIISFTFLNQNIPVPARDRLIKELAFHEETLRAAFDFRKENGPALSIADSDSYFSEKLSGMLSFAEMAVDPAKREAYPTKQIVENINHYSYIVAKLVAADWTSTASRPASDLAIKNSSFDNREALTRLVNR